MSRRPERDRNKGNRRDKSHDDSQDRHGPAKKNNENKAANIHSDTQQEASSENSPLLAIGDFTAGPNRFEGIDSAIKKNINRLPPVSCQTQQI